MDEKRVDDLIGRLEKQISRANRCCLKEHPSEDEFRGVIGGMFIVASEAAAALRAPADPSAEAVGIVQAISIAGTPMNDSRGVDWLKPVGVGTKLYAAPISQRESEMAAVIAAESQTQVVPCCGYQYVDDNYPVYWNRFNGVVQCHNCGHTWVPAIRALAAPPKEKK